MVRLTHLADTGDSLTVLVIGGLFTALVFCLIPLAVHIDQALASRARARHSRTRRGQSNRDIARWADEAAPRPGDGSA